MRLVARRRRRRLRRLRMRVWVGMRVGGRRQCALAIVCQASSCQVSAVFFALCARMDGLTAASTVTAGVAITDVPIWLLWRAAAVATVALGVTDIVGTARRPIRPSAAKFEDWARPGSDSESDKEEECGDLHGAEKGRE